MAYTYSKIISGIYQIKNLVNGKVYIGSSVCIQARWSGHRSLLRKKQHHSPILQKAWDKYGEENFEFSVLEEVPADGPLFERETHHIKQANCADGKHGYNTLEVGGSARGWQPTEEQRRKMSEAQRRIPLEDRLKYCISFAGRKHTEETKAKMSEKSKGRKASEYSKQRASETHKGKSISAEHRAIVGAVTAERNKTPEMREKVSKALKGRVFTPEWRAKLSAAAKARAERKRLEKEAIMRPPSVAQHRNES